MTYIPNADVRLIAIAELWEQPPIDTPARKFVEARVFSGDTEAAVIWEWAKTQTDLYTKLASLKLTREKTS